MDKAHGPGLNRDDVNMNKRAKIQNHTKLRVIYITISTFTYVRPYICVLVTLNRFIAFIVQVPHQTTVTDRTSRRSWDSYLVRYTVKP